MPMELQAKLLRVLQEREFQRLGSSETVKVDVRIIAATNVDLLERVKTGRFREDLFYRLNVVPIRLPALRERISDIPLLARHFLEKVCTSENLPPRTLGPGVLECLSSYDWPGNVRQLENAIEMAVVMSGDRRTLQVSDFDAALLTNTGLVLVPRTRRLEESECIQDTEAAALDNLSETIEFEEAVRRFERSLIERAISEAKGNKSKAARILGLKRTTLVCKLKGLDGSVATYAAATA
jgi:DNA-binding NtrC family response regulator